LSFVLQTLNNKKFIWHVILICQINNWRGRLWSLIYLLTYNLASLSGPNSARARAQLTLCLMKQFRSNSLTLY
jgi:hypothetical protein